VRIFVPGGGCQIEQTETAAGILWLARTHCYRTVVQSCDISAEYDQHDLGLCALHRSRTEVEQLIFHKFNPTVMHQRDMRAWNSLVSNATRVLSAATRVLVLGCDVAVAAAGSHGMEQRRGA
jgi:hypothetical protein